MQFAGCGEPPDDPLQRAPLEHPTSGLYSLNEDQIAERGARMARRDDRGYRRSREEQRRQTGCPAREVILDERLRHFWNVGNRPSTFSGRTCADTGWT